MPDMTNATKRTGIKVETYRRWLVTTGKAASGGWLSKASREGIEVEERGKTRKATIEAIEFAIDLEMESPWWRV